MRKVIDPGPFGILFTFCRAVYWPRIKVKGIENIPQQGAAVVAVDPHFGSHDPFQLDMLFQMTGRTLYFVATYKFLLVARKVKKFLPGAEKFYRQRLCAILQEKKKGSRQQVIRDSLKKLSQGCLVGFFICGKLVHKNPSPKPTAVEIALIAQVPIIPVLLKSSFKTRNAKNAVWNFFCPWKRACIYIGQAIDYGQHYKKFKQTTKVKQFELLKKLTQDLQDTIHQLNNPR